MKVFTSLANPEYETTPFTDFVSVKPRTDLSSLNLNWRERDLPERERTKHVHRLHPYLGKYIPQLVEIFLRKFRPTRVYDPFCGCGTTLVEANALGIESVGCDISKFNCVITQAKTAHYDLPKMEHELRDALSQLSLRLSPSLFSHAQERAETDNQYLLDWFHPDALRALLIYRFLIPAYEYQDLMSVILSRSARSARLTTHHNLDFPAKPQREPYECRKHGGICKPTTDAYQFLSRYTLDTVERVKEFASVRTSAKVQILWDDARTVKLPKFDMIMTSPPYVGLIDYHEQHRYAYELLNLPRRDEDEIGAASKGSGAKAGGQYLKNIGEALTNARHYLMKGGVAVIVIGDRKNLYTDSLAKDLGFRPIERLRRHVNRRTGRRNSDFFEDVLIWKAA
jgi:SAM-dependent methyltransferase